MWYDFKSPITEGGFCYRAEPEYNNVGGDNGRIGIRYTELG